MTTQRITQKTAIIERKWCNIDDTGFQKLLLEKHTAKVLANSSRKYYPVQGFKNEKAGQCQ